MMPMIRKLTCFLLGHRYEPPQRHNPPWVVSRLCTRCRVARVEMDTDEFKRGGYVDAEGVAILDGEKGCTHPPRQP